eukprot:GHVL01036979.1.p1 GENE.GHVL01036979.1~~GHVL01036979.1.p1  ORF type:complete len:649 (-),score=158.12 GHVL01036979.1:290-2236(-)
MDQRNDKRRAFYKSTGTLSAKHRIFDILKGVRDNSRSSALEERRVLLPAEQQFTDSDIDKLCIDLFPPDVESLLPDQTQRELLPVFHDLPSCIKSEQEACLFLTKLCACSGIETLSIWYRTSLNEIQNNNFELLYISKISIWCLGNILFFICKYINNNIYDIIYKYTIDNIILTYIYCDKYFINNNINISLINYLLSILEASSKILFELPYKYLEKILEYFLLNSINLFQICIKFINIFTKTLLDVYNIIYENNRIISYISQEIISVDNDMKLCILNNIWSCIQELCCICIKIAIDIPCEQFQTVSNRYMLTECIVDIIKAGEWVIPHVTAETAQIQNKIRFLDIYFYPRKLRGGLSEGLFAALQLVESDSNWGKYFLPIEGLSWFFGVILGGCYFSEYSSDGEDILVPALRIVSILIYDMNIESINIAPYILMREYILKDIHIDIYKICINNLLKHKSSIIIEACLDYILCTCYKFKPMESQIDCVYSGEPMESQIGCVYSEDKNIIENHSIPATHHSIPATHHSIPATHHSIPATHHSIPQRDINDECVQLLLHWFPNFVEHVIGSRRYTLQAKRLSVQLIYYITAECFKLNNNFFNEKINNINIFDSICEVCLSILESYSLDYIMMNSIFDLADVIFRSCPRSRL